MAGASPGLQADPVDVWRTEVSGPMRIQLSRSKGWRMPPNTVKVDRTTAYGNPWKVGVWSNHYGRNIETAEEAVERYQTMLAEEPVMAAVVRDYLRGKNLACWCRLDQPCHADVLLKLANQPVCGAAE